MMCPEYRMCLSYDVHRFPSPTCQEIRQAVESLDSLEVPLIVLDQYCNHDLS